MLIESNLSIAVKKSFSEGIDGVEAPATPRAALQATLVLLWRHSECHNLLSGTMTEVRRQL